MIIWLRGLQALLAVGLSAWVVGVGPLAWVLRDGLGPDAVDSAGLDALAKFSMTFFWGPVALSLMTALAGLECAVRRLSDGGSSRRP